MNDNDKKKKRKKTLLIILVLLLLLIIGIIISFSIAGTDSQNGGGLNPSSQSSPGSSLGTLSFCYTESLQEVDPLRLFFVFNLILKIGGQAYVGK